MERWPRRMGAGREQCVALFIAEEPCSSSGFFFLAYLSYGIPVDQAPFPHGSREHVRQRREVAIDRGSGSLVRGGDRRAVLAMTRLGADIGLRGKVVAALCDLIGCDLGEAESAKPVKPPGDVMFRVRPSGWTCICQDAADIALRQGGEACPARQGVRKMTVLTNPRLDRTRPALRVLAVAERTALGWVSPQPYLHAIGDPTRQWTQESLDRCHVSDATAYRCWSPSSCPKSTGLEMDSIVAL